MLASMIDIGRYVWLLTHREECCFIIVSIESLGLLRFLLIIAKLGVTKQTG